MKTVLYVAGLALAVAAGYFWGLGGGRGDRADTRPGYESPRADRRVVELPADEVLGLRERAERARAVEEENTRLRERLRQLEPEAPPPDAESLPLGARRKDGSIVGGATFPDQTKNMAIGFVTQFLNDFLQEANLTEVQKQNVLAGFEERIEIALQISADFVNGDATGDEAYERLETMAVEGRELLAKTLDENQMRVYRRTEREITEFVHQNIVGNEMATLRRELDLDREQEKHVRRIVEGRYRAVQEKFAAPLPNLFFKPVRRAADGEIFTQSANEIRQYLRPEQVAGFDALEANADEAFHEYRGLLVPAVAPVPPK